MENLIKLRIDVARLPTLDNGRHDGGREARPLIKTVHRATVGRETSPLLFTKRYVFIKSVGRRYEMAVA